VQSKIYQCARLLPAPFKLAITGTPMENNLMELWSLLSIAAPGLFPSPTRFDHYYARPIEKRGDAELLACAGGSSRWSSVELRSRWPPTFLASRSRCWRWSCIHGTGRSIRPSCNGNGRSGLIDEKHQGLPSAKVDALLEQLPDVTDNGHRALIFSQFTGFLDVVRRRLDAEGVEYCYLDGTTRNRATVLKRFKEGNAPVFLISLKAGGFGLNLTEADYCFLLDPWWNPATEAQAVDRIHRIGQSRNVMVYRLIAKDTIEQKVMALKARKAELFASVMDEGNAFGAGLDADDIRGLFA
jgi:SNF2 family DNA or RNA helicase